MQLNFNIGTRTAHSIDALRVSIGAADMAEVLRRALTLLQLAVRTEQAGGKCLMRNADSTETEIRLR
jgi:hypothetical protein